MEVFTLKNKSVFFKCCLLLALLIIAIILWPQAEEAPEPVSGSDFAAEDQYAGGTAEVTDDIAAVAAQAAAGDEDFFALFRTERQKQRSKQQELYQSVLADDTLTAEEKQDAKEDLEEVYRRSGLEDKVETILKARNYQDVVFSYEDPLSLLIVRASSLTPEDETSLRDFVAVYCGLDAGSISVFAVS